MLTRVNIVYMDLFGLRNILSGQHVSGNFCPYVDLGQHLDFTGGQHVFGISGPNVDPGQHVLHGTLLFKKYFERST